MKLHSSHVKFLFDRNDSLNIFNLVRLFKSNVHDYEISLDTSGLSRLYQESIAVNFTAFLNLYKKLISSDKNTASLIYSGIKPELILLLTKKYNVLKDNETLIFELNDALSKNNSKRNPHFVKNIRGAVLLSLVQDLVDNESVDNHFSIFDEKSPLLLHSASDFLHNDENAMMMWNVLRGWESEHELEYKKEINRRIQQNLKAKKDFGTLSTELTKQVSANTSFSNFIELLQTKVGLEKDIYRTKDNLDIWFVDDQYANGWLKLMKRIIPDSSINLKPLSGVEDVNLTLSSSSSVSFTIPDLALVDLRLSDSDQSVEDYNAHDLSGFQVVDMLLEKWSGLPIMITSASSKLWNMEKAIERGAVTYWRKSDEATDYESKNSVLTAFDINLQFIEKLTLTIKRTRYKYIFRIVESLRSKVKLLSIDSSSLQRCIEHYAIELEQKTSWMCWKKTDEIKVNDSLYLGVMEVFNELEPLLCNNQHLTLDPSTKVKVSSNNTDNQVINKTLDFLDQKYDIGGVGLNSRYMTCKSVRNKLPIIHGSEAANDIRHATFVDIETSLLIAWCLLNELVQKNRDNHSFVVI
ncbi:response regulator [Vibrio lentus]|uniref:response regulator n=1 Tax=Vibrio lentus TaxID=136468 RepID=UPI001056B120|nr:response regulator [Vibrio lentus]MCC4836776.1 response regulator [Vibrio lentus]